METAKGKQIVWHLTYIMRCMLLVMLLIMNSQRLAAQGAESGDSIRINPKFMEELDKAFSFGPVEAPIKVPDNVLTREQLHEWVGPVEGAATNYGGSRKKYDPTDPNRFDSTYFALKMYMVDFCKWQPIVKDAVVIPGLGGFTDGLQHYGKYCHSTKEGGVGCTLDVNALAKYLRPSEIRLRKSRALAEKTKVQMDKIFPMEGEPVLPDKDTLNFGKQSPTQ